MASNFDETRFKKQVSAALDKVRTILETNRAPNIPEDVPHQYNDKYLLADGLANNAIAAQLTCLQLMGLSAKGMLQLKKWSNSRTVTLRLTATETCVFDRKVDRKVENATQHVTEYSGTFYNSKHTHKSYHEVTEYFWKFDNNYEIFIYEGNDPAEKVSLCSRSGSVEIITGSDNTPKPKSSTISPIDVNISWLLQNITDQMVLNFAINRSAKSCHTPRRNNEIEGARSHFQLFYNWAEQVRSYFTGRLFPVETGHGYDLGKMTDNGIFIPVVPLFEETRAASVKAIEAAKGEEKTLVSIGETSGAMLSNIDVNNFLLEHKRSLEERLGELAKMYPAVPAKGKGKLISAQEANIVVSVMHLKGVAQHFLDGVDYVEHMLRKQLIAAIGKEVQPSDFTNYMRYHNRQLFRSEYEPSLFCYAVRRPDHYPEGTLSIESSNGDGQIPESILTSVCKADVVRPMYFSISAGIDIHFTGERYLHAWVSHQFSGDAGPQLKLTARARQFSCFMVLLGTIADEHQFLPSHAVIIQNKDDLKVPLSMEQIPTPKEFKDSIHSLSPEQQRFARAYRSMQLAQTLFAVCIIQIKPQLEKLLKLDNDSLTKEIKLTQDLLELFIKYQIPSDLISYAGPADAPPTKKVDAVKAHVAALNEMLEESRKREIQEAVQGRKYNGPKRKRQPNRDQGVVLPQFTRHFIKQSGSAQVQDKPALGPGDKIAEGDAPALPLNYEPDYTKIPAELDRRFEQLDEDSALRPTILKIGGVWEKTSQEALLADPVTASLNVEAQEDERDRAFDLLDALSRSGCLSVDQVALHVVLAATHCFDKTLMDTVIQNNVNPIEKVERSTLIVAATIQNKPPGSLLREDQVERVKTYSPMLFSDAAHQLTRPSVPLALEAAHQPVADVASKDKGKKPVKVVVA